MPNSGFPNISAVGSSAISPDARSDMSGVVKRLSTKKTIVKIEVKMRLCLLGTK
jgi:hypothetical protein